MKRPPAAAGGRGQHRLHRAARDHLRWLAVSNGIHTCRVGERLIELVMASRADGGGAADF